MKHRSSQLLKFFCIIVFIGARYPGSAQTWDPGHAVGTLDGVYNFSYNQTPSQLVEIHEAAIPNTGLTYQWESSITPIFPVNPLVVGTSSSYTFSGPLSQTTYYRRKSTYTANGNSIYSNTIKISIVSVNWEDINYIREHDVITTGITSWTDVDQLTIGQKLQTTNYLDGIGRSLEKISRETATPSTPNGTWGDMVQYSVYDDYGREAQRYLPYTTTTQSGKFKTTQTTEQTNYYSNPSTYNETSAFSTINFDNSPLNRVKKINSPGTSWANSAGNRADYDMNTDDDDIKVFITDYTRGDAPVLGNDNFTVYPANTLYKITYTDENSKTVIEFINKLGQLILKKVELNDTHASAYDGWICTYNVYDDFGLLRYQIQPEGVNYLNTHSWVFDGGGSVLNELSFQYDYDDKGRMLWKKAPGAKPLNMLYDIRDRVVFMQDGNQSDMSPAQWTANLYDELDRPIITTLYNTTKTIATLQSDIDNAPSSSSVTVTNPNQTVTDLVLSSRDGNIPRYAATNSIEFISEGGNNFESLPGDEFTAEIDPSATTTGYTVTTITLNNPVSSTDLNNPAVITILKYQFYDNYSFSGSKSFDNNFTNTSAYSTSDPNVMPIAKSIRTISMPTGGLTRILGTNIFLAATQYYDEKGRAIQTLEDNIKSGTDISTLQYHFDGRVMSACYSHTAPGTGYTGFLTLTKYIFDKLGRTTSIQKQFGSNAFKTISSYDFDDIGRVKTKHLDPGYNNPNSGQPDLESLNYSFNIHNQVTGINKDFALKTGTYNKWSHFFGLYLGFDNRDGVFGASQLNGQVAGQMWNTQGDDAERKYEYSYDDAGRLTKADYMEKQHTGDSWSNTKMDFSVKGTSGQITYDLNGNILNMLQRGVVPGMSSPIDIDKLDYSYTPLTNKLISVTDQMATTSVNGKSGDFADGSNGSNPDYVYDDNGNVVIDLNKNAKDLNNVVGANGIHYNFLDKPDQIRIAGKGTINIVYSADGEKLKRTFTPEGTGTATVTTYIDQFVYQSANGSDDALSYINFEEGRIRIISPTTQNNGYDALTIAGNMAMPNNLSGVYDYYIMDYQQNVRMILTEETHVASNMCTMETNRSTTEDAIFGQTGAGNEVETTRYVRGLTGWTGNTSASVSRLGNLAGSTIGPNVLQKVMAGDNVTSTVQYYYQSSTASDNPNFISNLLSSLVQAISGSSATSLIKDNAANISNQLNVNPVFLADAKPNGSGGTRPQAYLTILFFDERFNFIAAADGGAVQTQVAASVTSSGASLSPQTVKAPKNGYVYIYVSNRSDKDVYFDNLNISIAAGNIIEENHYYSFGLKIASISSKKLGDSYEGRLDNKYLYNGKELFDDADLNWYDYGFRNYDPQIGRFMQLDPLTFYYPFLTPYQYASDEPITNIDIDGLEEGSSVLGHIDGAIVTAASNMSEFVVKVAPHLTSAIHPISQSVKIASQIVSISGKLGTVASTVNEKLNTPSTTNHVGSIKIDPKNALYNINTRTSCHIMNDEVLLAEQIRWYNATKDLDREHGQVLPPRSKLWDIVFGRREVDDPTPVIIEINNHKVSLPSKRYVGANGYLQERVRPMLTGTPPVVGFGGGSGSMGFIIEEGSQLEQIWNDGNLFEKWIKASQSSSRVASPLNEVEAQQLIDNAKRLGIIKFAETNPAGLAGMEKNLKWGNIPHFKIGGIHIPIQEGVGSKLIK